jgi:YggT family protein
MAMVLVVTRYLVAAFFLFACLVALAHWAVRQKKINAFGPIARFTRSVSNPLLRPIERKVIRFGGNPQDAPFWLIGIVVVGGLILLSLVQWLLGVIVYVTHLGHGDTRAWISLAINAVYFLLTTAILLRVLGSWVGIGRYHRWMRFAYRLTDWIVEPIRRLLPGFGFIDVSPLVAWLLLWIIRGSVARIFLV